MSMINYYTDWIGALYLVASKAAEANPEANKPVKLKPPCSLAQKNGTLGEDKATGEIHAENIEPHKTAAKSAWSQFKCFLVMHGVYASCCHRR